MFDLKTNLKSKLGSDLLVTFGRPEAVVPALVEQLQTQGMDVGGVWINSEVRLSARPCSSAPGPLTDAPPARQVTTEEITVETRLSTALSGLSSPVSLKRLNDGFKTLVHPADVPFALKEAPDVFTSFRKAVEGLGEGMIRPCLPTPTSLPPTPDVQDVVSVLRPPADKSTLESVLPHLLKPYGGAEAAATPAHSAHPFTGGETSALARLEHYCVEGGKKAPLASYKQTRNGMVGPDYSTKLSGFLGLGCVSARRAAQFVREWQDMHTGGKGTKDSCVPLRACTRQWACPSPC